MSCGAGDTLLDRLLGEPSLDLALLAKPMNGINAPQRPDCVARVVRLELEYPCASHVFEMS